jgi:hypothetical protein
MQKKKSHVRAAERKKRCTRTRAVNAQPEGEDWPQPITTAMRDVGAPVM